MSRSPPTIASTADSKRTMPRSDGALGERGEIVPALERVRPGRHELRVLEIERAERTSPTCWSRKRGCSHLNRHAAASSPACRSASSDCAWSR
jgi:hypothetical protein